MADHKISVNGTSRATSCRKALARLGLAAGVAYAAPTTVHLNRSANAKTLPSPCPPQGKGKGKKGKKGC